VEVAGGNIGIMEAWNNRDREITGGKCLLFLFKLTSHHSSVSPADSEF
jgi:hypothetical protein